MYNSVLRIGMEHGIIRTKYTCGYWITSLEVNILWSSLARLWRR
jgi:hypothetical protein